MTLTCDSCRYPIWTSSCVDDCDHRTHCDCDDSQTSEEHESPDTLADYDLSCGRTVKRHAVDRWRSRNDLNPPCDIGEAWEEALSVGASEVGGYARLHPPTDLVLVAHGNAVRTVLLPKWAGELSTSHLVNCEDCGLLWYPAETDECPWCDGDYEIDRETTENTMNPTGTSTKPAGERADSDEMHDCPVCSEDTLGDGDDDRCKVCRELGRTVDEEDEEDAETCAECFQDAEPGSNYCELHSYLEGMGGVHAG